MFVKLLLLLGSFDHAGGKAGQAWARVSQLLKERGVAFSEAFTEYQSHAIELTKEALRAGYRKILTLGGDGAIHEILNGVMTQTEVPSQEVTIAMIPVGSGNDWLKSLGVPHDIEKVVRLIAEGSSRMQDVISVHASDGRTSCMSNVGGTGFDSQVCERVNARKERGHRSRWI